MNDWSRILSSYRTPEAEAVRALRSSIRLSDDQRANIAGQALRLAAAVRAETAGSLRAESFLQRYSLSTHEGVVHAGKRCSGSRTIRSTR
jgi:hypothetical protein